MSGFPLRPLAVECCEQFGVDWDGDLDTKAGNYFAFATAFPSSKVITENILMGLHLKFILSFGLLGFVEFDQDQK